MITSPKISRLILSILYFSLPLLSLGLQQYASACGIGLTFDSFQYLQAARDFEVGHALRMADGSPFVAYPPFFPWVLSWFGGRRLEWMPVFQGFLLLLNLMIWLYLGTCYLHSVFIRFLFGFSICLSTPFLLLHSFLWSEPLFVCLLSGLLLYFHFYPVRLTLFSLCVLLSMCVLLILQRNAGIWWSLGVLTWSLFFQVHARVYFRWMLMLSLALVLGYGWYLQSILTDYYKHASLLHFFYEFIENIGICTAQLGAWFLPLFIPWVFRSIFSFLVLGLILWALSRHTRDFTAFIYLLMVACGIYGAGLLILRPSALHYADLERFMAVMVPGFFLIYYHAVQILVGSVSHKFLRYTLYFSWILFLIYPAYRSPKNAQFWQENHCKSVEKSA